MAPHFSFKKPTPTNLILSGTVSEPRFGQLTARIAYDGPLADEFNPLFLAVEKRLNNTELNTLKDIAELGAFLDGAMHSMILTTAGVFGLTPPEPPEGIEPEQIGSDQIIDAQVIPDDQESMRADGRCSDSYAPDDPGARGLPPFDEDAVVDAVVADQNEDAAVRNAVTEDDAEELAQVQSELTAEDKAELDEVLEEANKTTDDDDPRDGVDKYGGSDFPA